MRRWQQHKHLTSSYTSHNPRFNFSSVPEKSAITFGYSSGYPSGITSNIPTKYPSLVEIIKVSSVLSETPTRYPSNVPKELPTFKFKQHVNLIHKWRSNSCSHHHDNWQVRVKFHIVAKLRTRYSQAKELRGISKYARRYNTILHSYHLVFVLKENIHIGALARYFYELYYETRALLSINKLWI